MIAQSITYVHMIAQAAPSRGVQWADSNEVLEIASIAALIVLVLFLWFLGQRVLAVAFVHRANAFCPYCGSGQIKELARSSRYRIAPFLPRFSCTQCGTTFLRGRKSRFARCPRCRSSSVQGEARVHTWRNLLASLSGAHTYRCSRCSWSFADRRPVRAASEQPYHTSTAAQGESVERSSSSA